MKKISEATLHVPICSRGGTLRERGHRVLRTASLVAVVTLAIALTGCLDPTAVGNFAAIASRAADRFPKVAGAAYDACVTQQLYSQLEQRDRPDERQIEARCAQSKATRDRLIAAHKLLAGYLGGLSRLAADGAVVFDEEAVGLVNEAGALVGFTDDQKAALGGLGGILLKATTDGWRRRQLKRAITEADPHVATLAAALAEILTEDLNETLDGALQQMDSYYATGLAAAAAEAPDPQRASESIPVRRWKLEWIEVRQQLGARRDGVNAYVKVLKQIAAGHRKLYEHRDDIGSRRTLQTLFQYASKIREQLRAVEKAFGGNAS